MITKSYAHYLLNRLLALAGSSKYIVDTSISVIVALTMPFSNLTTFSQVVNLTPGVHHLYLDADAKRLESPNDPRSLYYAIFNFGIVLFR